MSGGKKSVFDENREKPSKYKQWQEKSERPIAARAMTRDEIEEHRINLVKSYQCNDTDIVFVFQKITDNEDVDRDDCIWLKYRLRCVVDNKPQERDIFSIKLPLPEELKKMAENIMKQQARNNRNILAIEAPPEQTDLSTQRPKLRKPIRPTMAKK